MQGVAGSRARRFQAEAGGLGFRLKGLASNAGHGALWAAWCCFRGLDGKLARPPQIRVDPRLPALAGFAIGLHHIFVEPERDCGFRLAGQRWPAATDQLVAMTQFAVAKESAEQFGGVVGIIGQGFAEVCRATAFLPLSWQIRLAGSSVVSRSFV